MKLTSKQQSFPDYWFQFHNDIHYEGLYGVIPSMDRNSEQIHQSRGYKRISMDKSAEHEILNAHKYKHMKKFSCCFFSGSDRRPGSSVG